MEILENLIVIFAASAAVVFVFNKAGLPSIAGFLVAGVIIGPSGLGLVSDAHAIEVLAEIGVILLLFTIGIEFSVKRLARIKKLVLGSGSVQVLLTIAAAAFSTYLITGNAGKSVFFGFIVALSSTAIVLKTLSERSETDTPHGRLMLGVLIFQDLCVIPLMLLVPVLGGSDRGTAGVLMNMLEAGAFIAAVLYGSRKAVPWLLHQIVRTRSRELFIITIILMCLGIAFLSSRFGLSLALGAFLAGLTVSESEYAHQATSDILPFKDSFIGLFFVSIGMLIDIGYVYGHPKAVVAAVILIIIAKAITGTASGLSMGMPLRASIHAGIGLSQIGEFSFVLSVAGRQAGLISWDFYQMFLSSSVVTMALTPFALKHAHGAAAAIASFAGRRASAGRHIAPSKKHGHVIIVGFGLNGKNLAYVLKEAHVPYSVLELNSDTVREMKNKGEPISYGDGSSPEILRKAGVDKARLLVVAISDPVSTRNTVSAARHENPGLYILVRTRYLNEVSDLKSLGADEVIPEEFETSIEIFARVLHKYDFPQNTILDMAEQIREDSYSSLRSMNLPKRRLFDKCEWLPDFEVNGFGIKEGSHLISKSISELHVRTLAGVTILAVRRGAKVYNNPEPGFKFLSGDVIIYTGERKSMDSAISYFKRGLNNDTAVRQGMH